MWKLESGSQQIASERERRTGDSRYVKLVYMEKVEGELMEVFIRIGRIQENLLSPALQSRCWAISRLQPPRRLSGPLYPTPNVL